MGAHARHYNAHSIGICYEGGLDEKGKPADTRTPAQKDSLEDLLYGLSLDYPDAEILGHRDLPWVRKSCPCFDVKEWLKEILALASFRVMILPGCSGSHTAAPPCLK